MAAPIIPALGALRVAAIADIHRIAVVATAGFYYSPVFQWERPLHARFPFSTLLSYEQEFAKQIRDPEYIVIVAEDDAISTEDDKTNATIVRHAGDKPPKDGERVIVGIATWQLKSNSPRRGQFMDHDDESAKHPPVFDGGDGADMDKNLSELLDSAIKPRAEKYFPDHFMVDMVVVHPAYWRHGHASTLMRWGNKVADIDHVDTGVVAATSGEPLYANLGYTKDGSVTVENENKSKNVTVGFWERQAQETAEL